MLRLIQTDVNQLITLSPITTIIATVVDKNISSTISSKPTVSSTNVVSVSTSDIISSSTSEYITSVSTVFTKKSSLLFDSTLSSIFFSSFSSLNTSTSLSVSTGFTIDPKTSSLNDSQTLSSKTGLIVGLCIGLPAFFLSLLGLCYYFFYKRNHSIDSIYKNKEKNFSWSDEKDECMVKDYSIFKNITTPVETKNESVNNSEYFSDWKAHIKTPYDFKDSENNVKKSSKTIITSSSEFGYNSSIEEQNKISAFLYKAPPNIKKINSFIASPTNKSQQSSKVQTLDLDSITKQNQNASKWIYQSPLSKWFLRDSTYLQPSVSPTTLDQTLSIDLKTLRLLSKHKKKRHSYLSISSSKPKVRKHLIDINAFTYKKAQFQKALPTLPKLPRFQASVFHEPLKNLKEIRYSKYIVIKSYAPQMLDELEISVGEFLSVISVHSDGWALVAKLDNDNDNVEHTKVKGIVPMLCLKKID
ncbi:hypothetical protein QEN19_002947 [Hanseniaspora menglaensis]